MFSQIKDKKHIEQNFHSVAKIMPRGWTCGCWGESKTLALGFAMAPNRLRTLVYVLSCNCITQAHTFASSVQIIFVSSITRSPRHSILCFGQLTMHLMPGPMHIIRLQLTEL